ncbi:Uncharacterised protein r2_g2211 [Pycnogonum litorale]
MENIETTRGEKKLEDGGFLFTVHSFSADQSKKFWRCVIRSCKCRPHTSLLYVVVKRVGQHTHGSDAAGVEVAKVRTSMKRRALETMELPSQIHNHAVRDTDEAVQGEMPSYSTTRKLIQRVRSRNDNQCFLFLHYMILLNKLLI